MKHTCETIYFSKAVQLELLVKIVKNLKTINYFGESSLLATLEI